MKAAFRCLGHFFREISSIKNKKVYLFIEMCPGLNAVYMHIDHLHMLTLFKNLVDIGG